MDWIVLILAAGLLWLIGQSAWLSKQKWIFVPQALLALTIGAALSETFLGQWIGAGVQWFTGLFGEWTSPVLLAGVMVTIGFGFAIVKLLDKSADRTEQTMLMLLPSAAIAATGVGAATLIATLSSSVAQQATAVTTSLLGG